MRSDRLGVITIGVALALAGCASRHAKVEAPPARPASGTENPTEVEKKSIRDPCDVPEETDEAAIDSTRRRLYETVCGASLWFDGLFGNRRHVDEAKQASGRLELSALDSEYEGFKLKTRFDVRVKIPNLDKHLEAFFGRDDQNDFVRDRREGLGLRSQFSELETEDRWVAGLGYGLPGSYRQRVDFRVGAHGGRTPEVFAQARLRRNLDRSEDDLWHWRETAFWTNRDGFGLTSSLDYDHVLNRSLLFRWGTIGTYSEVTHGLDWRSALVFYQNLSRQRAIAYETFVRGETDAEVGTKEYGLRTIFRFPFPRRDWLFGEVVGGYGWPRERLAESRRGSATFGVGIDLRFGGE